MVYCNYISWIVARLFFFRRPCCQIGVWMDTLYEASSITPPMACSRTAMNRQNDLDNTNMFVLILLYTVLTLYTYNFATLSCKQWFAEMLSFQPGAEEVIATLKSSLRSKVPRPFLALVPQEFGNKCWGGRFAPVACTVFGWQTTKGERPMNFFGWDVLFAVQKVNRQIPILFSSVWLMLPLMNYVNVVVIQWQYLLRSVASLWNKRGIPWEWHFLIENMMRSRQIWTTQLSIIRGCCFSSIHIFKIFVVVIFWFQSLNS